MKKNNSKNENNETCWICKKPATYQHDGCEGQFGVCDEHELEYQNMINEELVSEEQMMEDFSQEEKFYQEYNENHSDDELDDYPDYSDNDDFEVF